MSDVLHMPTAMHGLASAVVGEAIYFAGGATGGWNIQIPEPHFLIYNTTAKTWSRDYLSIPRAYLTLSKVGHYLVFVGGATREDTSPVRPSTRIDIFDTLLRTWSTLELHQARFAHVATTYGDKIFVAGGAIEMNRDVVGTVDTIEMIDLVTNNVSIIYQMNTSRFAMSSGTIMDVVFFASGRHGADTHVPEVYMYNVTSGKWRIEMLVDPRSYSVAAVYGNNIYIAGGWLRSLIATNRIDVFNIETRQWSLLHLQEPRGLMAAAVLDTKLYFAGGIGNSFPSMIDVIDAVTGEQLSLRLSEPRAMMTAPSDENRIYFAGGLINEFTNSDVIEVFDKRGIIETKVMPRSRTLFTSVASNRLIFFAGGYLNDGSITDSVDIYDERTGQWREGRLSQPRASLSSTELGHLVFFIGGVDSANNTLAAVDIYNTLTSQWSTAQLAQGRILFSVTTADSMLFIAGGSLTFTERSSAVTDAVDIYDSRTDRWTTAKLSLARAQVSSFAYQSLVFFAGGFDGTKTNREVDIYNVRTNTWSTAQLRVGRSMIGINAIFDRVIFAGGLLTDQFSTRALDVYNIVTGQWTFSQLTAPRFDLKVVRFADYLMIGAGIGNSVATPIEVYNGYTGRVTDLGINIPRHGALATAIGTKYLLAGGFFINGGRISISYSSAIEVFETNTLGGGFSSYFLSKNIIWRHAIVSGNRIYYSGDDYAIIDVMELPMIDEPLTDRQQFLRGQTSFNTSVIGLGLSYSWMHDNEKITDAVQSSYTIHEVTSDSSGTYTVTAVDTCRNVVISFAQLEVLNAPKIINNMRDTVVLCGNSVTLSSPANGTKVQYEWFVNGEQQHNNRSYLVFQAPRGTCDADHNICTIATNPAGSARDCALLRVASYSRIFNGPILSSDRPTWLLGERAEISVSIVEPLCTSHEWRQNGVTVQNETGTASTLVLTVDTATETTVYSVIAHCGAPVESQFVQLKVVYLAWWGVLLVVLFGAAAITTGIVLFVQVRRRFKSKQVREHELKELLDEAKRAVITTSSNNSSVINVRRWEWIPDDDYSYAPLSDLPFTVDTSSVLFLKKNQQLEIGICMQGDLIFSFKSAKNNKSSSVLKEKLLKKSMQVSIYPPRSPKYELSVDPQHFAIGPKDEVRVLVSLVMKMTTKAKINLIIGLEEQQTYSAIEFNVASKISPWIDADEVIVQGDPIGMGGYGGQPKLSVNMIANTGCA